jgi:hypothetical protein
MMLFTALNGLGVVFLVYVLIQFWKEGHRPMRAAPRDRASEFSMKDRPTVLVVTHPISHFAHGGLSVVSRQVRLGGPQDRQLHQGSPDGTDEAPLKRFSAQRRQ